MQATGFWEIWLLKNTTMKGLKSLPALTLRSATSRHPMSSVETVEFVNNAQKIDPFLCWLIAHALLVLRVRDGMPPQENAWKRSLPISIHAARSESAQKGDFSITRPTVVARANLDNTSMRNIKPAFTVLKQHLFWIYHSTVLSALPVSR